MPQELNENPTQETTQERGTESKEKIEQSEKREEEGREKEALKAEFKVDLTERTPARTEVPGQPEWTQDLNELIADELKMPNLPIDQLDTSGLSNEQFVDSYLHLASMIRNLESMDAEQFSTRLEEFQASTQGVQAQQAGRLREALGKGQFAQLKEAALSRLKSLEGAGLKEIERRGLTAKLLENKEMIEPKVPLKQIPYSAELGEQGREALKKFRKDILTHLTMEGVKTVGMNIKQITNYIDALHTKLNSVIDFCTGSKTSATEKQAAASRLPDYKKQVIAHLGKAHPIDQLIPFDKWLETDRQS